MHKIFVNSLPKSGTHLLLKCLELFGFEERGHIGSGLFLNASVKAYLRRFIHRPIDQGCVIGIDTPIEVSRKWLEGKVQHVCPGQFITGHVGYTCDALLLSQKHGLIPIIVVRDPRAVLNSFVHYVLDLKEHVLHREFCQLTSVERYRYALFGHAFETAMLQPLKTRCHALDPWVNLETSLTVRFEDIVGAKGGGDDQAQLETLCEISKYVDADEKQNYQRCR